MTASPQTWSNITPQLAAIGQNLFAATDSGLYVSTNSGGTWKQWNKGLPTANGSYINAITISGGYIIVSTFEDGVWYRKLSDFGIS
jgi:ligand-binding sensor domain-containing protein